MSRRTDQSMRTLLVSPLPRIWVASSLPCTRSPRRPHSSPRRPHCTTGWILGISVALLVVGLGLQEMPTHAQSRERIATERRLAQLKEQIDQDQTRLSETAEAEEASRHRLESLRREIALREELAATYQQRLDQLSTEQDSLRSSLEGLESRLGTLKAQYRRRATHAYKYGRLHDLALILAARSINQMLIRVQYLHRFAAERREKLSAIERAATALQHQREELQTSRNRTEQLLREVQAERQHLRRLQGQRRNVIAELRARRTSLQEEIARKQSTAQQLEARIRKMIAAEGAEGRTDELSSAERAAYAELSASFEDNRGHLPWPTDGVVTEPYGDRVDPVYGTTTRHPGIQIATNPEAAVRAVFDGEIAGIDFVPGYGTYLVVRHGDYLSVYSNFSALYVFEGQSVRAGQLLGRAGTDDEPRGAGLFFAVFDTSHHGAVDPETWLRDR